MKCRNLSEILLQKMKQLLETMIKYWIYLYCLSGIQSYSYSCPLSDTLFTSAPCCEEQGFYSSGFTGVCFTSTRPNQRSAYLSACWGEPVCHWCDSHHQRRTSAPCRAVSPQPHGGCLWGDAPANTRHCGHGVLLGLLPHPLLCVMEYQL